MVAWHPLNSISIIMLLNIYKTIPLMKNINVPQYPAITIQFSTLPNSIMRTPLEEHCPSDHAHTILIDALENSPFEKEKELGEKLKILKRNRVHADYRKSELRDNQLKTSKKKAEEIFILLDELIKHPVRLMKN